MHDIICPHCNKAFKVDETGYADILKQVRDADFHAQLHERLELAEQDKRNAIALAQAQVANELQKSAAAKDSEIQGLQAELDAARRQIADQLRAAIKAKEWPVRGPAGAGAARRGRQEGRRDPAAPIAAGGGRGGAQAGSVRGGNGGGARAR